MRLMNCGTAGFASAMDFSGLRSVCALITLACTTTLDPSVDVGGAGGAGGAGQQLTPCELFTSASSEYLVCPERLDNAAATADCARRDAALVTIESREENDF